MNNNIEYYLSKFFKKIRRKAIKNSNIHHTSKVESGSHIVNSSFDKHSFCGYDCQINNTDIGSFCSIADNVIIGPSSHPFNWVGGSPVFYSGRDSVKAKFSEFDREKPNRTVIGNDVWIGINAIIKSGVKIGHGAIIGMGSVVTKDVEPYAIVGGCPAKIIKKRFDDKIIKGLLESNWWNLDEFALKKMAIHIKNPILFLENYKKLQTTKKNK
jgi:chloramphenicol O-acetyltransferase type B